MNASADALRGSCLCGAVKFEIATPLITMGNCHCTNCQKQHGTAFATYCQTDKAGFRVLEGHDHIRHYASSEFAERGFCGTCGTKLTFTIRELPERIWIAAGAFDDDPGMVPGYHIFVGSRAPWYEITDDVPQYAGYPEDGG